MTPRAHRGPSELPVRSVPKCCEPHQSRLVPAHQHFLGHECWIKSPPPLATLIDGDCNLHPMSTPVGHLRVATSADVGHFSPRMRCNWAQCRGDLTKLQRKVSLDTEGCALTLYLEGELQQTEFSGATHGLLFDAIVLAKIRFGDIARKMARNRSKLPVINRFTPS